MGVIVIIKLETIYGCHLKIYFVTFYFFRPEMGDKVKTKLDRSGEVKAFSQTAMANNHAVIEYCRETLDLLMFMT